MGYLFHRCGLPLFIVERLGILRTVFLKISHLPTLLLLVGFPVYWLELYCFKARDGVTSWAAWGIFLFLSIWTLGKRRAELYRPLTRLKETSKILPPVEKLFITVGSLTAVLVLICAFYAALLPPHLTQEFDALQYHITLPRQHLLYGSFQPLAWSSGDFFLMPVDVALAPFWLASVLPNKIPQFLFLLGLIVLAVKLVGHFTRLDLVKGALIVFAVIGSHGLGIQMGTAMLDIVLCYLALAALDSFLSGNYRMAVLEFCFLFWSKSFMPVLWTAILAGIFIMAWVSKVPQQWDFGGVKKFFVESPRGLGKGYAGIFLVLSLLVGGPFLIKSVYSAGTPFFPFFTGLIKINPSVDYHSVHGQSILAASQYYLDHVKEEYGHGRSLWAFLKHFWLIAVPENGVNNAYDYPLGLAYLLVLGPFLYFFIFSLREKKFVALAWFVVIYWLLWWFGSQQTRFLYIPFVLMMILAVANFPTITKTMLAVVTVALILNAASVIRAHQGDWGRWGENSLREKDLKLVQMSREYLRAQRKDIVSWMDHDVAYAQFPVKVVKEKLPFALAVE